jgi:hypothetical protein
MWELLPYIAVLALSHVVTAITVYITVCARYEHKIGVLRLKARIITGFDPAIPDERFPD